MKTTIRFRASVKNATRTVESGITRRGNCVLRTIPSWASTELTAPPVASWKKPKTTRLNSSSTG